MHQMQRVPEFRGYEYAGLSYEQASRKAQQIADAAARSGQTIRAAEHLGALADIMMRHNAHS